MSILTRNVQLLEPTLILVILKHIFQLGARVKQLLIRQFQADFMQIYRKLAHLEARQIHRHCNLLLNQNQIIASALRVQRSNDSCGQLSMKSSFQIKNRLVVQGTPIESHQWQTD